MEFNKIVVQDALFSAFTYNADGNGKDALSIESATCGKIKIKIPWNNLYSDRCELVKGRLPCASFEEVRAGAKM